MAEHGKIPDKLKGAGSFLMKVFGALAVCTHLSMTRPICLMQIREDYKGCILRKTVVNIEAKYQGYWKQVLVTRPLQIYLL